MKLILSRKGFDSEWGGCASPIFPDNTLYSLPIPDSDSKITYGELQHGDVNIGEVVVDLTDGKIGPDSHAHLDPDINYEAYPRQEGWRPLFGQSRRAQSHLCNQDVQVGDLFLFFGFYQQVKETSDSWGFIKGAPEQHILWGWLQIGEICKVDELAQEELPWTRYHPHRSPLRGKDSTNTLYIASGSLDLGDGPIGPGAGQFPKLHLNLILTEPGKSRSYWRLPRCFYPDEGKCPLTHFPDPNKNWDQDDKYAYAHRRGPGQEFVLDLDQYPGVMDWLTQCIFTHDCGIG